jgi:hypothetical protein
MVLYIFIKNKKNLKKIFLYKNYFEKAEFTIGLGFDWFIS